MPTTTRLTFLLACASLFVQGQDDNAIFRDPSFRRLARPVVAAGPHKDDATRRRQADLEWYGGEWTPAFRKFMIQAAATERNRYSHLMPIAGAGLMETAVASGNVWSNLGPTNADVETNGSSLNVRDSGRPVSIVSDPANSAILYLATAGGGVWKTLNGGTTWAPITETVGSLNCGFLTMDPNNSSILYLGLGDTFDGTGIGLLKTTDGGLTWGPAVFLGNATKISSLIVTPQNSNILLAATNVGLFRSTDAGASWAAVSVGTLVAPYCWTLASTGGTSFVMSLETNHAANTGTTGGQIWRTADAGATWTQSTGVTKTAGVGRITVASAPSLRTTLYAMAAVPNPATPATDFSDIFKSTDGGISWTALGADSKSYTNTNSESAAMNGLLGGQGWYNHAVLVDPTNPSIAYFGGQLLAAKTTNGGSTFAQVTNWLAQFSLPYVHADFHCAHIDAAGNVYFGTDGGIFKSTDGAATFTSNLNIGITSHLCYSVGSSLANRSAIISGLQDNGTRVRSGSTSTFNQPLGGDGFGALIHPTNATNLLGTLYYTRIYKSTNSGSTFSVASTGIPESNNPSTGVFTTRIVPGLADATGNTVYTFANQKVYKSTNFAGSWSALGISGLPTAAFYIRGVAAAKSNASALGIIMNGGRVYLTANAGSTWTLSGALPNNGSSLSYIWFDTNNYNTVYVASVAPDSTMTHLWKSQNFGSTWAAIDGNGFPAGVPVNCVQNDPGDSNTLYAGTHLGLYKSTDGGTSWSRFGTGMPLCSVTDFYLSPDSSLLRASTFGRGLWELNAATGNVVTAAIATPAGNLTMASGTAVSFSGSATDSSSSATLSYAWNFGDSGTAAGASASHIFTNTGSANVAYTTTFTATDNTAASGAATRVITVTPAAAAPILTTQPQSQSVTAGLTATFSVVASGTAPFTYQWSKNGAAIAGATAASYTTPATVAGDSGSTFAVVVSNATGSVASTSATLTVTTVVPPPPGELVLNGGFETGTTSWTGTTAVIGTFAREAAFAGTRNAVFGGTGTTLSQTLYQGVTIPASATAATLTFQLHIDTAETGATAYDFLKVEVLSSTGTVLATLASYSNANAATGYALKSFDLSAYKGQTIRINFRATEDSSLQTSFAVDNVSLNAPAGVIDTILPVVSAAETGTAGMVTLSATATDNVGVTKVDFYLDSVLVGSVPAAPYSLAYDSTKVANGSHSLVAKAFDAAGNVGVSTAVAFTVNNTTPPPTQLILNPGFESGATSWTGTTAAIGTFTAQPAFAGTKVAFLGGKGTTTTAAIAQTVTIPATATTATLTFQLHIDTAESGTTAYDYLYVQVLNPSGTVLGTLATYNNSNKATGYALRTLNLTAYKGQTVQLAFKATEDSSLQTSFVLDEVNLNIN